MTNPLSKLPIHSEQHRTRLAVALLLVAIALFVYESWEVVPQYDDSYITYRYAQNFVEGHGLVYNLGEYVEGYTNLLWALLIAAGIALGIDAAAVGHALSLVSGSCVLVAVFAYAWVLAPERQRWMAAVGPSLLLGYSTFVYCSTNGMETPLSLATTTAALAAFARGRIGLATVFVSVATMTRPDGILIAAALFAAHFFLGSGSIRQRLMPVVPYLAVVAGLTIFRLAYYGSPVPNTFYAKVGGLPLSQGLEWSAGFLSEHWLLLLPFAAGLAYRACWAGGLFIALNLAYVIVTASSGPRLILPIIPVAIAIALSGAARAMDSSQGRGIFLFGCILGQLASLVFGELVSTTVVAVSIVAATWTLPTRTTNQIAIACAAAIVLITGAASAGAVVGVSNWRQPLATSQRKADLNRRRTYDRYMVGRVRGRCRELRQRPDIRLIAAGAIGALGYYSKLPIVDILGLVDPVVARSTDKIENLPGAFMTGTGHQRSNAAYVMARKPDYVQIAKKGTEQRVYIRAVVALWAHPDLERCYRWDDSMSGYLRQGCVD